MIRCTVITPPLMGVVIYLLLTSARPTEAQNNTYALDAPAATLSIDATPTGNMAATRAAMRVEGRTAQEDEREFLVEFGLTSATGANGDGTPYKDKVTLYAAIEAQEGTGDVWAINPLLTMAAGSGDYNAQGVELDFNNENAHRGDADGADGLAQPVAYGFAVTGAAAYRSTAAIAVMGAEDQWNRGIVGCASNAVRQATFVDYCSGQEASVDITGRPKWGIRQRPSHSDDGDGEPRRRRYRTRNLLTSATGIGREPTPGFALTVGSADRNHDASGKSGGGSSSSSSSSEESGGVLVHNGGVWLRSLPAAVSSAPMTTETALSVLSKFQTSGATALDWASVKEALPSLVRRIDNTGHDDDINGSEENGRRDGKTQRSGGLRGQGGEKEELEEENYAMSLDGLVALLVEGAKEQQGVVRDLTRRVNELEQQLRLQATAA